MVSTPERIGKYEVLSEIGKGAMGTVYKARDPVLDRYVAVKMMSDELLVEDEMCARFNREARSAAKLQHANIVTIFDFGQLPGEGAPFIVMELLDGESLAELMEKGKPERLEDKIRLVAQVCQGLDYAHKRGVIHRDVKPGNIQVLPDRTAKILDFGIAKVEGPTINTKTGLVMGTPNYMAPEQISSDVVDHRADMWAVGVLLYEMLGGERPFTASTVPSLVYRVVHSPPPPLDARKLGLPEGLVAVVDRALRKKPDERFRDAAQMSRALERALGAPASTKEMPEDARARSYGTNLELARNLLTSGQPQRALEAARRAQALEPSHPSVVDLVQEIEKALRKMQSEPTVVQPASRRGFDAARWIDEARMELTAGNRSEALRIVEDVLAMEPGCEPALELRQLLDKPARPGRARTGSLRPTTYRQGRLRPAASFERAVTFGEPPGIQVMAVGSQPNVLAVGGLDGSIRLWDLSSRRRLASLRTALHQSAGHEALVTSLAFSPDGAFLAAGHVDGKIHLWGLDTGEEVAVKLRHEAAVGQVAFSPDGAILASGGLDSTVKLWDLELLRRGEAQRRLVRQPSGVTALVFSSDGALLVTGHTNRLLRVHDARSGRLTATLRGHEAPVSTIVLSPDENQIATAGRDATIRIFDLNRREEMRVMRGHKKPVAALSYFPDGAELASVAMDATLVIWDLATGAPRATLCGSAGESFAGVVVTSPEPLLVAGLEDGRLRVWMPD